MFRLLTSGAMAVSMMGSPVAAQAVQTPTELATVSLVSVDGKVCSSSMVGLGVVEDNSAMTVTYKGYEVTSAGETGWFGEGKICKLVVSIVAPKGYTYGTTYADYAGAARIPDGDGAFHRTRYYFEDQAPPEYSSHPIIGPYEDDWYESDLPEPGAGIQYAPCGKPRPLVIETELRISSAPDAGGLLSMTASDGTPGGIYQLVWKKC